MTWGVSCHPPWYLIYEGLGKEWSSDNSSTSFFLWSQLRIFQHGLRSYSTKTWSMCLFLRPEHQWCVVNMMIDEHGKWLPGQLGRASQNVCLSGSPCPRAWLSASQVQELSTVILWQMHDSCRQKSWPETMGQCIKITAQVVTCNDRKGYFEPRHVAWWGIRIKGADKYVSA